MSTGNPDSDTASPATVLVVEPDILVRFAIADYLRDCGYKVLEGVNADDVLAVLQSGKHIDVLFPEVHLEGVMDGFGLAQWIRDKYHCVDVILTSGIAKAAKKAGDLCEDGPLNKPYHSQEVIRRINVLRERRRTAAKD